MGPLRHITAGLAGALLVVSVVGLVRGDDTATVVPSEPGVVAIAGFMFNPEPVEVAVGSTVTWMNTDSTDHTVNSEAAADGLDSGSLKTGDTYEKTFHTPGTFTYICAFHPFMQGTVEVTG